jgi:arsenate reductase
MSQYEKVLFVCLHNSARSQMAEELLNKYGKKKKIIAKSGGIDVLDYIEPHVLTLMKKEEGIDLSNKKTTCAFDLYREGHLFHYVISLCDHSHEKTPCYPGITNRIEWEFEDPLEFNGSEEEVTTKIKKEKDEIKAKVLDLIRKIENNEEVA